MTSTLGILLLCNLSKPLSLQLVDTFSIPGSVGSCGSYGSTIYLENIHLHGDHIVDRFVHKISPSRKGLETIAELTRFQEFLFIDKAEKLHDRPPNLQAGTIENQHEGIRRTETDFGSIFTPLEANGENTWQLEYKWEFLEFSFDAASDTLAIMRVVENGKSEDAENEVVIDFFHCKGRRWTEIGSIRFSDEQYYTFLDFSILDKNTIIFLKRPSYVGQTLFNGYDKGIGKYVRKKFVSVLDIPSMKFFDIESFDTIGGSPEFAVSEDKRYIVVPSESAMFNLYRINRTNDLSNKESQP